MATPFKGSWGSGGWSDQSKRTPNSTISRSEIGLLVLVMVFGAGLRLHGLSENGIWKDEMFTLIYSSGSSSGQFSEQGHSAGITGNNTRLDIKGFKEFITKPVSIQPIQIIQDTLRYEPSHPPLYYVVENVALAVLGVSDFGARLSSVIFGVLTIPFVFLIGHRLHSTVVGLIAAGIFATAPFEIYYGQEARMYAMLTFCAVVSTWLLLVLSFRLSEGRSVGSAIWPAYTVTMIAGAYTHLFFIFVIGVHLTFVAMNHRNDQRFLRRWLAVAGCSVLLVSLWFGIHLLITKNASLREGHSWLEGRGSVMDVVEAASGSVLGLIWTPEIRPYKIKWIWIIFIALGFLKSLKPGRLLYIPIWVLLPPLGIVMIDMLFDTHITSIGRFFCITAPALYLLVATGIMAVRPVQVAYLLTIVVLGYLVFGAYMTGAGRVYQRDEYKKAAQEIAKVSGPDQRLVVLANNYPEMPATLLAYYLANDADQPGSIEMVAAKDPGQAEIARVFDPERRYSHLTVVVATMILKDKATQIKQISTERPGYLELEDVRKYRGLTVLSFRSARST